MQDELDRLPATAAYSAMMLFLFQADAAAIDVPVLLAYGDKDLFGPPQEIVRYYPKCNDIGLLILPERRWSSAAAAGKVFQLRR